MPRVPHRPLARADSRPAPGSAQRGTDAPGAPRARGCLPLPRIRQTRRPSGGLSALTMILRGPRARERIAPDARSRPVLCLRPWRALPGRLASRSRGDQRSEPSTAQPDQRGRYAGRKRARLDAGRPRPCAGARLILAAPHTAQDGPECAATWRPARSEPPFVDGRVHPVRARAATAARPGRAVPSGRGHRA